MSRPKFLNSYKSYGQKKFQAISEERNSAGIVLMPKNSTGRILPAAGK